jgi:tape measure domain-containing protein
MTRKDVDLVIRAKDEAASVVDSITAAINEFIGAQDKLGTSTGKTNSTLGALGTALAKLDSELKGLSGGDKITQEFDRASAAVGRLKSELSALEKTSAETAAQLDRAQFQTEKLTAKTAGAAAAQAKQQAALNKTRAVQNELTAALTKANAERTRLASAEDRLSTSIVKQQERVAAAAQKYRTLSDELSKTANPTQTFRTRVEAASVAVEKQTATLNGLWERLAATRQGMVQTGEAIAALQQRSDAGAASFTKQSAVLAKITTNYEQLKTASKGAERNENSLAAAAEKTDGALARQGEKIVRAETELQQFAVAANKADAAMLELASKSGAALQSSFDKQRRTLLETKRTWVELQTEAGKLAAQISRVGVPTREMAESFIKARAGAAQAKQEYITQRDALHQLSGVLKQTATSVEGLKAKQAAFVAIQGQTGTALAQVRERAAQAAQSYNLFSSNVNRAGVQVRTTGTSIRSAGSAAGTATAQTNTLAAAYRKLYGESRQALSWTQRLRSEVLALITTYAGFYAVINILKQTVDAYQTLQSAQNRLNVINTGDARKTADDLDFLRRNAERLGIQFGVMANEYSKFAVATQGTNLEGEKTRKIFISVAEAARVNNLSMEDVKGTFVALSQIVGKGTVQMEELRQQLGDRFPGAVRIMAAGLGYADDQLRQFYKDIENGRISSDALVNFADELDRRFKATLPEALKTTITALGQFQNAAFEALLAFGNAGFLEAFTNLLRDLTALLRDVDFQTFAGRISQGFGVLTSAIGLAVQNFKLLVVAASAFIGIKLAPLLIALAGGFVQLTTRMQRVGTIMAATRAAMIATAASSEGAAVSVGLATTAFRGLTLALRALLSSTGIGLAITAISIAIGLWVTQADEATVAMDEHRKMVDAVKNAYDAAAGEAGNWADEIARGSTTQAIANLQKLRDALNQIRSQAKAPVDVFGVDTAGTTKQIEILVGLFKAGQISAESFKEEIDALAQADPKLDRGVALQLLAVADSAAEVEKNVREAEAVLALFKDPTDEAAKAVLGLSDGSDKAAEALDAATKKAQQFQEALDALNGIVPDLDSNLSSTLDKARVKLEAAYEAAVKLASSMGEVNAATTAYNNSLSQLYQQEADKAFGGLGTGRDVAKKLIMQTEGFQATTFTDTDGRPRVGFSSDTVTLADGSIQKVVDGMRVSVQDANRDLNRRIEDIFSEISGKIGADTFNQLTPQQQGALASISYNYGSLPDRIVKAFQSGSNEVITKAIQALGRDNGGINQNRRNLEAGVFSSTGSIEKQIEADQKYTEDLQNRLSIQQQEAENAGKMTREATIQKAIFEETQKARAAGHELTKQELETIREITGKLYDSKQQVTDQKSEIQQANEALSQANAYYSQQQALIKEINDARKAGDDGRVQELGAQLEDVNAKLTEAITKAEGMWQAIGGSQADVALTKLDTLKVKMHTTAQTAFLDWSRVGQLFASGLTSAFDQFAQAVAEGQNIGEAARDAFLKFAADFLRQIAQMIIQQAILNALRSFGLGGVGGVGIAHTGAVVGRGSSERRTVDPMIFMNAARLHGGGIAGLQPGEVPYILKNNEEVLSTSDPRNILNGGAAAGGAKSDPASMGLKIVNAFDTGSFIEEALNSKVGERAFLNWVRANPAAVKQAMNP